MTNDHHDPSTYLSPYQAVHIRMHQRANIQSDGASGDLLTAICPTPRAGPALMKDSDLRYTCARALMATFCGLVAMLAAYSMMMDGQAAHHAPHLQ